LFILEGHIGIVKEASLGIKDLGSQASSRSNLVNVRHKRAISQDYTFDPDYHNNFGKPMLKSGEIKRRNFKNSFIKDSDNYSFSRPKNGNLSDAGNSIMNMSSKMNNSMTIEDANRSIQPRDHYSEIKRKVGFWLISKCMKYTLSNNELLFNFQIGYTLIR
jgi:hypothetical protein